MNTKVLIISMCTPYKNSPHAGGNVLNFNMEKLLENDIKLSLISFCEFDEKDKVNTKITFYPIYKSKNFIKKYKDYLLSINSKINPFYKYGNNIPRYKYKKLQAKLTVLNKQGYKPDVIVMEWAQITLFIDVIKTFFPYAKYIATEHDVMFQAIERKMNNSNSVIRLYYKFAYRSMLKHEIDALKKCNHIFVLNNKDRELLINNSISKDTITVIEPFFNHYMNENMKRNNDIIFFGAMNRKENYESVLWFIRNVFSKIDNHEIRFVIIGGNPPKEILQEQNNRILVKGYVDNVQKYLSESMCMVAPLLTGAGIKIKVLEGLSAGIPILTNTIGIEGIPARNGIEYFHCENVIDYLKYINLLSKRDPNTTKIGFNGSKFIEENYEDTEDKYSEIVLNI